jgi:hypothetical protein
MHWPGVWDLYRHLEKESSRFGIESRKQKALLTVLLMLMYPPLILLAIRRYESCGGCDGVLKLRHTLSLPE